MWEVLCGRYSENPSYEGRDVELGARTSKHISVFAFDPIYLTLLFCLALIHIVISFIYAWFVCVPHLYSTKRASYSTSTLI